MTIHVVGGGLAGMTVAWELCRALADKPGGPDVVLYERATRLGGKAGSNGVVAVRNEAGEVLKREPRGWSDHGYHLFPTWYRNVIEVMGQIGVTYEEVVVEGEQFSTATALRGFVVDNPQGEQPPRDRLKKTLASLPRLEYEPPAPTDGNRSSRLSPAHTVRELWAVAVTALDLVARRDKALRAMSVEQFLRRKHPGLKTAAMPTYESLLVKALSARPEDMSALAVAKMFRRWSSPLKSLWSPTWSSLSGSLQLKFIAPFREALEQRGVDVRMDHELIKVRFDENRATALEFGNGFTVELDADDTAVLAVPPDVLHRVSTGFPALAEAASQLASMTSPFAGVDVYFDRLQRTPRQHFGFEGGVWTTAYDITPIWDKEKEFADGEAATVLQLVVPQAHEATDEELIIRVKNELASVFDFTGTAWVVNRNEEAPLSLANTGVYAAWDALPSMPNLLIAGDFMDSSIGVPSMEGAVGNGRRAAAQLIGQDHMQARPWWKRLLRTRDTRGPDPDVRVSLVIRALALLIRPAVWIITTVAWLIHVAYRLVTAPVRAANATKGAVR